MENYNFFSFTNSLKINNTGPGGLISIFNGLNGIPTINGQNKIVEIGCNTGFTSRSIAQRYTTSEVIGVDISAECIRIAKQEHNNITPLSNLSYEEGDVTKLNFKNNSIDVIIISGVLGFVDNHKSAIQEISRVLKPNGHALIIDFFYGEEKPSNDLFNKLESRIGINFEKFDLNYWLKTFGTKDLEIVGFESLNLKYRNQIDPKILVDNIVKKKKAKNQMISQDEISTLKNNISVIIENFNYLNQGSFLLHKNDSSLYANGQPSMN